ncbi:hypothetical protein [Tistrella mobilis]|uniref:Nif11 domain-containing protein n=1 Tax=Tistrella mobilis (strain KA081020-065) TaxID=1110502 RepID=I3TQL5_TISMK|nr:hypothetical protein [Tistrella mobilis]AFK55053.1 hypothetical protein TMO_3215 [Tistrella mobilis KA081020-065]
MSDDSARLLVDLLAADPGLAAALADAATPAARDALLTAAADAHGFALASEVLARIEAARDAVGPDGAIDDTALERVTGGAGIDWISVAQGQIYGG